ncbi:cytochrome o ubiquinol oxidase subunit III [Kangiella sp. TOML190]|uniref:cytochrome o ubiquinol oxidase subunit III n=1 Tax=Kangiella sp. TOML190 TaxID=2931351 RepID=UPI00203A5BEF|nr:cytochrome o ubiquinol oxidase subunit III [Kangiella sp. TOML190]
MTEITASNAQEIEDKEHPMGNLGTPASNAKHGERALGFWFYLMSDSIIFALLFANYEVLINGVADGPRANEIFEIGRAAQETALLLLSSFTFGMITISALSGKRNLALIWLVVTFILGAGFIVLELLEFKELIDDGHGPQRSGFLSSFFALVATHGLHVLFGLIMLAVIAAQMLSKGLTEPVLSRLYRVGLFWHFLDLIWIGIFSIVYLPGIL